jgi:hypothetical protein
MASVGIGEAFIGNIFLKDVPTANLTDEQEASLKRLRSRCDELVAQNGPAMSEILASNKRPSRRKSKK